MTQRLRFALFFLVPIIVILDQWSKAAILNDTKFNALGCLDQSQYCG